MNRIVLKYLLLAMLTAALLMCGIICLLLGDVENSRSSVIVLTNSSSKTSIQNELSDVFVAETALSNTWTTQPSISSYQYQQFTTITGAAEHGEVRFSVYKFVDGEQSTAPVNSVLSDFTLTDGSVSDEVKSAMNTLDVLPNEDSYVLTATALADGYNPMSESVEFKVTKLLKNRWTYSPQIANWVYGDTPKQIYRDPNPLAGEEKYTLEGFGIADVETYDTLEEFNERLGRTGADALGQKDQYHDYTATVYVDETDNYAGLSIEIVFRIKKKIQYPDDFDGVGFYIKSFPYGTNYTDIDWSIVIPSDPEITRAFFSAIDTDGNIAVQHDVILRDGADPDKPGLKSRKIFIAKLSMLDAGTYTVRADVFEGDTYGACSSQMTLEITRAVLPGSYKIISTVWEQEPYIDMGMGQFDDISAVWEFGKTPGIPTAIPRPCARYFVNFETLGSTPNYIDLSGELIKTYYKRIFGPDGQEIKGEKLGEDIGGSTANMPKAVGKYFVEFSIRESKNYYMPDEAVRMLPFEITMANDWTFTTNPYAVGWTWGEFDKNVNLFGAVPTRGGAVDFTVKKNNAPISGLEHFRVDAQNVIIDENGLSDKLNALGSGVYTLEVHVSAAENYTAFTTETVFRVSQAANSWTTSPNIARWAQYYFKAEENTPKAAAKYGCVVMEVRKKDDNELYYKFENGVTSTINLANAKAGWYTFTASVAETSDYSGLNYEIEFQVFSESADTPTNYWVIVPIIDSWIAGTTPSTPIYQSLRGEVLITYCRAELRDGKYVAVGTVTEQQPEEPGKYFMYARIRHEILPQDELLKHDIMFEIFERVNEWTITPSIQNYTLGEGPSTPVADVLYTEDCVIDIKYKPKSGGDATSELPRIPGEYVMVVTATAKYCTPLTAEVNFIVSLSQNSWVNAPTIKDWSEEEMASTPFGEAAVGSEHIVYTYARADKPDEILADKPTSEGDYIMYATLKMDGYETLTAQWEFTIISAFDRTLMTFDIILGVVCCICTAVAIFFAIKRSRQNG